MGYSFIFNLSQVDIDFNPRTGYFFNYEDFLINEFFNSSDKEMSEILHEYAIRYGQSALEYLEKNYCWRWRQGERLLTNVQRERILYIMPGLLNPVAKAKLEQAKEESKLRVASEEVSLLIKGCVQMFFQNQRWLYDYEVCSMTDIENAFKKEFGRAESLKVVDVRTNPKIVVLNEDEQNEALAIAKYIIYVKLKNQIYQIERDLKTFLPFMNVSKKGLFTCMYDVRAFNVEIDLTKFEMSNASIPNFYIKQIELNGKFKDLCSRYLAYELTNEEAEKKKIVSESLLNESDLKTFFGQYIQLSNSKLDNNFKADFVGEGGFLYIEAKTKSLRGLKTELAKSSLKILSYTLAFAAVASVLIVLKIWIGVLICLWFGGSIYIGALSDEVKSIKSLKSEIKVYG